MAKIQGPFITVPNLISLSRGVLIVPTLYLAVSGRIISAAIMGVIIVVSDVLDGYIARKTGAISDWGKVIDPVMDKFCVAAAGITAVVWFDFPLYALLIIVGRDILILLGAVILFGKKGKPEISHPIGKYTASLIAITILSYYLRIDSLKGILLALALTMVFVSGIFYFLRAIGSIKDGSSAMATKH